MSTHSRRRRFVPCLDLLQSRLVPSGPDGVITPMDPVVIGWDEGGPSDVVITPMDPVVIGWDDSATDDSPAWIDSAVAMGDGLILS